MYFDLISRNSKRNRKENSFYFSSLLISAIAFYLLLIAFLLLSGTFARQEIGELLTPSPAGSKKQLRASCYAFALMVGLILLGIAYALAILGMAWYRVEVMAVTLVCGLAGTLLFFWEFVFLSKE